MSEMAHTSKHHRHAVFIGSGDHFIIAHRATGLNHAADADFGGGANKVSLKQAKINFAAFGASQERFKDCVREPSKRDAR